MSHYWREFVPLVLSIGFLAGVVGNIVAALLWALPAFAHLHRKLDRHHAEMTEQAARHHVERLEQADAHHEAVMATLQAPAAASPRGRRSDKRLIELYGLPDHIAAADALALARSALVPVDPAATADDVHASIYRDGAAADGWLEANRVHYGHPVLAKVPLPDGRVIGILDLRPALKRAKEEQ